MNCKPGDVAIIIRSAIGNEGLIVTVLNEGSDYGNGWEWLTESPRPTPSVWADNGEVAPPSREGHVLDANLRPIRDNDGEDETLSWKDVPHKEHA